jgi:hypothetical protein
VVIRRMGEGKYIWNSRIKRALSAPDVLSFRRNWVSRRAHFSAVPYPVALRRSWDW